MSGTRLSDADLGRLLRAHLPAEASPALRETIRTTVDATRQQRSWPGPIGALFDADPKARRGALLLAAALLIALSAAVAGVVGAFLERRSPNLDLSIQPPADLPGFVRSTYEDMPKLAPMTITALEDGSKPRVIYVDGSGAIRIERYTSREAAEPETYEVFAGTSTGQLLVVDDVPSWYQQEGYISEDPRVFILAELGGGMYGTGSEYGCEIGISPDEVYGYAPGNAWRYVGLDTVAGRPAHHVTCQGRGDLWIDVETHLALRSQGQLRGPGGWPVAGAVHTIEVTAIEPGQPPPALFEIRRPDGAEAISEEEFQSHQCVRYGWCLASPRPLITPPPASDQVPLTTVDELVRMASEAASGLDAYAVTIEGSLTGMTGQETRTLQMFDGVDRYRIEQTSQIGTVWESTSVTLIGDGHRYTSEIQIDGTTIWRSSGSERGPGGYPLQIDATCDGGWEHRGVDLVAGRVADHVGCAADQASDFWIDRATHLVVRVQAAADPMSGVSVQEVVDLQPGLPEGVDWDLPEDADVRT